MSFLVSLFNRLTMSSPVCEAPWESPSVDDVLEVKGILFEVARIPIELIDTIIDEAEYWPHTSVDTSHYSEEKLNHLRAHGGSGGRSKENKFIIRSLPIGVLPEQIDSDTHLGITVGFTDNQLSPAAYTEPSESAKTTTEDLVHKWLSTSMIRGGKPCRKIVFTIYSHDQGWRDARAHNGIFDGSCTWFDVGLERLEACDSSTPNDLPQFPIITNTPNDDGSSQKTLCTLRTIIPKVEVENQTPYQLGPSDKHIVRNRTAHKELQKRSITWSCTDDISPDGSEALTLENEGRGKASANGEFVRNLKVGDVITVWSRARFRGWANHMEYCKIDVYWAI